MIFDVATANRIAAGRKVRHTIPRREPQNEPLVIVRTPGGEVEERPVSAFSKNRGPRLNRLMPVTVMVSNPELGYQRGDDPDKKKPRREGKVLCRVRILAATKGFLHEADDKEAHREGFQDLDEFIESWRIRYGEGPGIPGTPVYPIEVPVWVLEFHRVEEHLPRLLCKASDVNRGYTESTVHAVEGEGEAVEDECLDRYEADSQHDKVARLVRQERRVKERALEDRLAAVREAARESGVDVTRQLLAIERRIGAAETIVRKFGKAA